MGKGGSYKKLSKALFKEGIYNLDTGRAFTADAIFKAIWRWALKNLDESMPIVKAYELQFGVYRTDKEWIDRLKTRFYLLTEAQQREVLNEHPEYR
jgi:hypothetical protein